VARDRKQRSKQRRARHESPSKDRANQLVRSDVPGALDHASGEVDEFDAALVKGAQGVPVEGDATTDAGEALPVESPSGDEPAPTRPPSSGDSGDSSAGAATAARATPAEPRRPLAGRISSFMRASWAELQRVQWPDRPQVFQATAVVLGFVIVAGVYLGVADWVAQKVINFIL
jgi:preprotein translocase SecE subunit